MGWIKEAIRSAHISLVAGTFGACVLQVAIFPVFGLGPQSVTETFWSSDWSPSTEHLLNHLGLADLARHHPDGAFSRLEQGTDTQNPHCEWLLALAELADQIGRTRATDEALARSRDAAVYAVFCLDSLQVDQPDMAIRCAARDVHNRAVERCLHLARTERSVWPARLAEAGIVTAATVPEWTALGFDRLQTADDRIINRLASVGRRPGLGVPLIAQRRFADAELDSWKPYGPREMVVAATAVIRPRGPVTGWRGQPVELVLHDPLREDVLNLGAQTILLAHDLTSPLNRRLGQDPMRNYEYLGVVNREFYVEQAGVFAVDPYQPGRVPVVLVQGLWSGPKVWLPMLTALRDDPVLRASYQFWVVLYPSGDPLPVAAQSLRRSLREVRRRFDPHKADPALDQMVILGKSTGGQVVRMLAEPSGEGLWNAAFTRPINQVRATPAVRAELASIFFFEPEPYVRRVIFVATAHRGGNLPLQPGVRLGVELIRCNNPLRPIWTDLEAANGALVFQPPFQNRAPSSIDGLQAGSPLLAALDAQPIAPHIAYHSIIGNIRRHASPDQMSDGFVKYASAHLEGAASECIVTASHLCEADPEVIAEVRRILHIHLTERFLSSPSPPVNPNIRLKTGINAVDFERNAAIGQAEHAR